MDGEAEPKHHPLPPVPINLNPSTATSTSSSASSLTSSPPGLLRHVQAAFKRHRPLGMTQMKDLRARRAVVPTRQASRAVGPDTASAVDPMKSQDAPCFGKVHAIEEFVMQSKSTISTAGETHDDASTTPPSLSGTITTTLGESFNPFNAPSNQLKPVIGCSDTNVMLASHVESQIDRLRKVQFSVGETEWGTGIQVDVSTNANEDLKYHNVQTMESVNRSRSDVEIPSQLAKKNAAVQDQLHQFRNFLNQPATQSSVIGPSFATTTSVHSTSAPMLSSTTYTTRSRQDEDFCSLEPVGDLKDRDNLQCPSVKAEDRANDQAPKTAQVKSSSVDTVMGEGNHNLFKEEKVEKELHLQKDLFYNDAKMSQEKGAASDVSHVQSRETLPKETASAVSSGPSQTGKHEKAAGGKGVSVPRKRNYDPDLFFKVNGKLYQRLGKIGSGGSSEVHKVISSDCTIYALKKIKLKGRDYATAYGFCQEIEYLNKLRGKNNIIQLVDYEVTDKNLLKEVMSGSMNNKDGRVTDDGYIYMVLEYGEIDLAHMLSQKWKEMDSADQIINENWLRFYWQQILLAVNTIHEERIVHSDLKPANFLLVRGSLKLIDFGIAKAIMSDTTNIQRDSQVGTLSYMSPEAFMCNESDANGNIIKCGRPSDIWSLGCILYQMVYGRTPFAEYKTFWSKFKVITDPKHEITYGPVSNPWLLDIMKKCLAWDRNERWRIPQLLKHPFLVPPVPPQTFPLQNDRYKLLQQICEACKDNREASALCVQVKQILEDPTALANPQSLASSGLQCMLLSQLSKLCFQLSEHLSKPDR